MAYNKAKAEKEWLRWKEAEEKKLRMRIYRLRKKFKKYL